MGFSYQSNVLSISSPFGIQGGNFTVSDLMISSGQDPSQLNNRGDVHVLSMSSTPPSLPALTFTVGRHKTDAIADFWNSYVRPYQTTANDTPGSLNFAFTGSLVLQLSNPPVTVTINDMAIGQGSFLLNSGPYGSATVSNWWFGGKTCSYETDSTAKCFGIDKNGVIYYLHFQRTEKDGTNQANTLFLKSISDTP